MKTYLQVWYSKNGWAASRGFIIAAFTFVLVTQCISPAQLIHRYFRPTQHPQDQAFVAQASLREFKNSKPDILFLGGSSMRDAVPPRDQADRDLSLACGKSIKMFAAATSSQHPTDGWAILDQLKTPLPRLIVVGLSYGRVSQGPGDNPNNQLNQKVELPRSPTIFWENARKGDLRGGFSDFLPQLKRLNWTIKSLRRDRFSVNAANQIDLFDRGVYPNTIATPAEKIFLTQKIYALEADDLRRGAKPLTKYWLEFARKLEKKGTKIVFVWTPISAEAQTLIRSYSPLMKENLELLSRRVDTLDLRSFITTDPLDFRDPVHVSFKGRMKTWPKIVDFIALQGGCRELRP
jgi:hypothetical protein